MKIIPLSLFILMFSSIILVSSEPVSVIGVIDGDTIVVQLDGKAERVRLIGIDTMEVRYNPRARFQSKKYNIGMSVLYMSGKKAAAFVRRLVKANDTVSLEYDKELRDKYGRILAYVFLKDGSLLNELVIKNGHADLLTIPPNVKYRKRLKEALIQACGKRPWRLGCR